MTELVSIHDEGPGDRYFHIMLNMADDDLDPYEYRLLGHYRRVCGARNVPCTESTRVTAERCKMSAGKVSETRQRLAQTGWITVLEDGNRIVVTLVDRMPENVQRYSASECSQGERSPREQNVHQVNDATGAHPECSPHERDVHQVNETFTTRTICSPGERAPYIEKQQKQQKPLQTTPPTPAAPASAPTAAQPSAPAADGVGGAAEGSKDDADDLAFILPEVRKLHLSAEAQKRLLGLGAQQALAIAFAATARGVRNPAGLAVRLMDNGGPSDADLERAALALELRTLKADELDRHQNRREYERFMEQTEALVAERAEQGERPAPADDSLNQHPDGSPLTVRDCWEAAMGALSLRLGHGTFTFFQGLQPISYADGVLTVQAKTPMSYAWLSGRGRRQFYLDEELTRVARVPIRVHLLPPEGFKPMFAIEPSQEAGESDSTPESPPQPDAGEPAEDAAPVAAPEPIGVVLDRVLASASELAQSANGSDGPPDVPAETAGERPGEPLPPPLPELDPAALPGLWQQTLATLREQELPFSLAEISRLQVAGYAEGVVTLRAATLPDYQRLMQRNLTLGYVESVLRTLADQPLRIRLVQPEQTAEPEQEMAEA